MKKMMMGALAAMAFAANAMELKNGAEFAMNDVPEEMTVHVKRGGSVRFLIEENGTTGYQWESTFAKNECDVVIEHRGADTSTGLCGAPGKAAITVTKNAAVQSPSLVEFAYQRSWEKDKPAKKVRLVLYTIPGEAVDFKYPASRTLNMLTLPVAEVTLKPDALESTYPGRVVSIAQVDVVPQVSGEILAVAFANGQSVKTGDILYRIDPVKYEAAVKNAESKLAETKANAHYAEVSYERHRKLLESNAVSLDAVDNALSLRDSTRAAYAAAQADLVAAKDDLKHCTIVAPIDGKVGSTMKTAGNYVTAGSLVLVTIVQHDPVRISFSVSNREILELTGGKGRRGKDDVAIAVKLADGSAYEEPGDLEYVENKADETTDTVTIFAKFANPARKLVPGGTVAVRLSAKHGVMRPAIPPTAVLQDTQGPYVWVLDAKGVAHRRTVARGNLQGDWLFIEKGLSVGERVVADGAHRVRRGMTVEAAK